MKVVRLRHAMLPVLSVCLCISRLPGQAPPGNTGADAGASSKPKAVRVLMDRMPGGASAYAQRLVQQLRSAEISVNPISCAELLDPGTLTAEQIDTLVLPNSPYFPAQAFGPLMAYLRNGGNLVLLGGHAFTKPLLRVDDTWTTPAEIANRIAKTPDKRTVIFDFETDALDGWQRGASNPEAPSRMVMGSGLNGRVLRLELHDVTWYDVFSRRFDAQIPAAHDALCLWAKADIRTPQVFVEVTEADGSRWSRAMDVSTDWRFHVLPQRTFLFKADGSPPNRGGKDDGLRLSHGVKIALGLAKERTATFGSEHTIWIDEIGTTQPPPALTAADRRLLLREAFDDYAVYRLNDVALVRTYGEQDWFGTAFRLDGPVTGLSAVGFASPHESVFVPLLAAEDPHERVKGWAAGMLIHHAGTYAGSHWALFGVDDPAFYDRAQTLAVVVDLIKGFHSGNWLERARAEEAAGAVDRLPLESPPLPRLSIRNGHFVYPDGRRFFMIGVNFWNSFDTFYGGDIQWDVRRLERDFQRMHRAGINVIRIHGFHRFALPEEPHRLETFLELCRRYKVYVLAGINLAKHGYLRGGKSAMQAEARRVARLVKDETAILGYDLQNEPYWWLLAKAPFDGTTLGDAYPVPDGAWGDYFQSLQLCEGNWSSTFPGLDGHLPIPEDRRLRQAYENVNSIMQTWIGWIVEAIRAENDTHPITVGYNTILECLPANRPLDFVSHHVYEPPESLEHVKRNVTTLDRLRHIWPDRPVSLGEFGYSSGDVIDGQLLDMHTQAVGEITHWLYALANDYEGAMKWQLCDANPAYQWRFATWRRDESEAKRLRQRRFGMFWPDGTPEGRAKPIAHATRFLRECVDQGLDGGSLDLATDPNLIGTGYVFRGPNVLFVGGTNPETATVTVQSRHSANVMLRWDETRLTMLATADSTVLLDVGLLLPGKRMAAPRADAAGTLQSLSADRVQIRLLEGKRVTLAIQE